jgi:hypothetical protein
MKEEKRNMHPISKIIRYIKGCSKKWLLLLFFLIGFLSLKIYHLTLPLPDGKWISSNIENIKVKDPENFTFAVFGGNRFSRLVFEGVLKQVDHDPDIAFAIDLGDAVLKGKKPHYHHFIKQIDNNLGIPLLPVMGDNELKGGGRELYQRVFGPLYYSFKVGNSYFIVINNAEKGELDPDQMAWLKKELAGSRDYNNRIIFMHRPLYNPEGNNGSQHLPEESSSKLIDLFLSHNVTHLFTSDTSGYYEGTLKGIPYTITGETGAHRHKRDRKPYYFYFLKVRVEKETIKVDVINESATGYSHGNITKNRTMFILGNMVRVHWPELTLIAFALLLYVFYIIRKQRAGKRNEE